MGIQVVHNGGDYSDFSIIGVYDEEIDIQKLFYHFEKNVSNKTWVTDKAFNEWLLKEHGIREVEWTLGEYED